MDNHVIFSSNPLVVPCSRSCYACSFPFNARGLKRPASPATYKIIYIIHTRTYIYIYIYVFLINLDACTDISFMNLNSVVIFYI